MLFVNKLVLIIITISFNSVLRSSQPRTYLSKTLFVANVLGQPFHTTWAAGDPECQNGSAASLSSRQSLALPP